MLNKQFLSIQEIIEKTTTQQKQIQETMARGYFDRAEANIYHGLNSADRHAVAESIRHIPLAEFLSTATAGGGTYLVAAKVDDVIRFNTAKTDKVPLMSIIVDTPWKGADLKVPVGTDYEAHDGTSGATQPTETIKTAPSTLSPKFFSVSPRIARDLLEDAGPDIMEHHLRNIGFAAGKKATKLCLTEMITPASGDGFGTQNELTAGSDTTTSAQLGQAAGMVEADGCNADTLVCTREVLADAVMATLPGHPPRNAGYNLWLANDLDVVITCDTQLWTANSGQMANCISLTISRENYVLTGRKRWLKIENYADPVRDISGISVSCRQDTVAMNKGACCKVTES